VSLCEFLDETELWKWPRMGQIIWDIYKDMHSLDTEYIQEMRDMRSSGEQAVDDYIEWAASYEHFI